jgi:hypothetical protein
MRALAGPPLGSAPHRLLTTACTPRSYYKVDNAVLATPVYWVLDYDGPGLAQKWNVRATRRLSRLPHLSRLPASEAPARTRASWAQRGWTALPW